MLCVLLGSSTSQTERSFKNLQGRGLQNVVFSKRVTVSFPYLIGKGFSRGVEKQAFLYLARGNLN